MQKGADPFAASCLGASARDVLEEAPWRNSGRDHRYDKEGARPGGDRRDGGRRLAFSSDGPGRDAGARIDKEARGAGVTGETARGDGLDGRGRALGSRGQRRRGRGRPLVRGEAAPLPAPRRRRGLFVGERSGYEAAG